MGGRQAHGRPVTAKPLGKKKASKSKAKPSKNHRTRALDAYKIASQVLPDAEKKTPRAKHGREAVGEDLDDQGPRRKKARRATEEEDDESEVEYGSDDEGNKWTLGGPVAEEDDSEIDSDEAFGESDEENFEGFAFRGSKSKKTEEDGSDVEDDGGSLGDEAIDLATALDQAEEESEGGEEEQKEGEEESEGSSEDEEDDSSDSASEGEDDEDDEVPDQDALKDLVADFAGVEDGEANKSTRQKIDLKDLTVTGVKDANIRKSLKLMSKEEKETRPGASKKLDVPLPQRQQDRILRKAAYEKTTETLNRWTDTIKHNRRAEHLVFPLPQNLPNAVLNNPEMQPMKPANATSELEQTMFSLLEQSGLGLEKEPKKPKDLSEEEHKQLSKAAQKELIAKRRMEREAQSREARRAARLKKIKSKAYHRVHRKQKQKEEMAARQAMAEAGEIDSEEEREAQDRARALERVGARHKNSRWAKMGSKVKRAVWDDDYRAGLTDMARRDEELRRRIEGRGVEDSDDESSDSGSESEDEREKLRRQLEKAAAADEDEPKSGLMQLKFMKREEERQRKANDELAEKIRRDLNSDNGESEEEEEAEVGRRQYGMGNSDALVAAKKPEKSKKRKDDAKDETKAEEPTDNGATDGGVTPGPRYVVQSDSIGGAWSKGEPARKPKKSVPSRTEPLDLNSSILVADAAKPKSKPKPEAAAKEADESDADSEEGVDLHLPMAIRDEELIARAFAGDDVVAQFEQEKEELVKEQDDKIVDNTLPGWGSWTGEGVTPRKGKKYLTKVEGVKRKDRQDAKLDKVIISEKKVKKNEKYLASQLPHEFESREQYEGTLRLPMGKDFVTKETFQDGTKPRVIIKQGLIAPMSRPMV